MLTLKRPPASDLPGGSAPAVAPSYSPAFIKRQATVQKVPEVAPGTIIGYERGTLVEPCPGQVLPPKNSEFSRLERGPIRNYYVRDWYWRGWWNVFRDDVFPNAHVPVVFLPKIDGTIEGLPGGTSMTPRSRLTFTLSTPAWSTEPPTQEATSARNS